MAGLRATAIVLGLLLAAANLPATPAPTPVAPVAYDAVPLAGEPGTLVAVAGNIACGHTTPAFNDARGTAVGCAMGRTSDMILRAGDAVESVLAVGDLQYEHGEWEDLQLSFDPTWGRLKNKINPVPGSHEYSIAGAPDYYRYWGDQAHPDTKSNYSFETGGWKIYALSSACAAHDCSPGGRVYEWLKGELQGDGPDQCQLAYWHHPILSVGQFGNNTTMPPLARLLYAAGADVVVNAHDHNYQRWARITPEGAVDPDHGYRNFIIGSGGINHHRFYQLDPVRHAGFETGTDREFGVMFMKLNPQGYAWEYRTLGGTYTDTGREVCHREPGTSPVPVPATAPKPNPKGLPIPGTKVNLPNPPTVVPAAKDGTLEVAWLPPTKPGTAGPVDQYRISVYGAEPTHPTEVVPIAQRTAGATATSVSYDMSGSPGWQLRATVEARNPGGWGNPAVLSAGFPATKAGKATEAGKAPEKSPGPAVPDGWTPLPPDYPLPPISHPGTPRSAKARAGNGTATVTWRPPTTDGGSPMTGYAVYATPGGLVATAGPDDVDATVTGLVNDTPYVFQVTAVNDVAESAPTNETAPVTPTKTVTSPSARVPSAPVQVDATPGNGSATVTWGPPVTDGGAPVTAYTVKSSPDAHTATVDGTLSSARVDGLRSGATYTFTVTAKNAAGVSGPGGPSSPITLPGGVSRPGGGETPGGGKVTVPTHPRTPVAVAGARSAKVTWTAPASDGGSPLTGYIVQLTNGIAQAVPAGTTSTTFGGLRAGTAYRFTVVAVNRIGRSAQSDETRPVQPFDPVTAPTAPGSVVAAAGDGYAKVAWSAPAEDGGSPILSYTVGANDPAVATQVTGDQLEATVRGLTNGRKYTFTVLAENAAGLSPRSPASAAVTPVLGAPDPPDPVPSGPAAADAGGDSPAETAVSTWFQRPHEHVLPVALITTVVVALAGGALILWRRRRLGKERSLDADDAPHSVLHGPPEGP
ncbi:fibronectin type III domain-containing protein [Symbioplanes lichenis]|uniref:fibronectin type III domain-containing protein n=1 Tax=Symbioplanes lichenis TaxID=1629072 RepID=UPI002739C1D8|nr:fibronectin type III domain-containing protein [Actinoplanes lichenis]